MNGDQHRRRDPCLPRWPSPGCAPARPPTRLPPPCRCSLPATLSHRQQSGATTPEALAELTELDGQLQAAAPLIVEAVGGDTLARWRASAGPPPSAWWWALDEIAAADKPKPCDRLGDPGRPLHHAQRQLHRRNLGALPGGTAGFLRRFQHPVTGAAGPGWPAARSPRPAAGGSMGCSPRAASPGPRTPAGRPRWRSWC